MPANKKSCATCMYTYAHGKHSHCKGCEQRKKKYLNWIPSIGTHLQISGYPKPKFDIGTEAFWTSYDDNTPERNTVPTLNKGTIVAIHYEIDTHIVSYTLSTGCKMPEQSLKRILNSRGKMVHWPTGDE